MSVHVFDILKIRFIINFELDFWFCPTYKHCRHNRRKFLTILPFSFLGHMARDCKNPEKPRPDFRGGGVNRPIGRPSGGSAGGARGSWKPKTFGSGSNSMPLGPKKTAVESSAS